MILRSTDFRSTRATLRRRARSGSRGGLGRAWPPASPTWWSQPPPLTSTTLVLLPTPALAESSNSDVDTQVRIALSASILEQAGTDGRADRVGAPGREDDRRLGADEPAHPDRGDLDQRADEAQVLSQAVADGYVNYVRDTAREVTAAALADSHKSPGCLQSQIKQLQKEITATIKRQKATGPELAGGPGGGADCWPGSGPSRPTWPCSWTRSGQDRRGHARRHLREPAPWSSSRPPSPPGSRLWLRLLIWAPAGGAGVHPARGRRLVAGRPGAIPGSGCATTSPTPSAARCWRRSAAGRSGRWPAGRRCWRPTRRRRWSRGRSVRCCVAWYPPIADGHPAPPAGWTIHSR